MSDELRTAEAKFRGGFGLALVVSQLATSRSQRPWSTCKIHPGVEASGPVRRQTTKDFPKTFSASWEYYRIIDRIARGEKP